MAVWLLLFGLVAGAQAPPVKVEVKDIVVRRDWDRNNTNPNTGSIGTGYQIMRISSTVHNHERKDQDKLSVSLTVLDSKGAVLRQHWEPLLAVPAGGDRVWWAPPWTDPPGVRVTVKVDVLSASNVVVSSLTQNE
jgi:hypothetical protein